MKRGERVECADELELAGFKPSFLDDVEAEVKAPSIRRGRQICLRCAAYVVRSPSILSDFTQEADTAAIILSLFASLP
jgi:hypothetical protein